MLQTDELLLVVLRLLQRRSMTGEEIHIEFGELIGADHRPETGRIGVALAALAAEGLIAAPHPSSAWRLTPSGVQALRRRCEVPVVDVQQVTVLFTDLVGSTELLERVGDDVAHGLRRRHFALLRGLLGEHGGREVKSLGDGLMVVFAGARPAVECALEMQRTVASCGDSLEMRIGIATGEVTREDDDYFGRPVIVARRLCDVARGGEVLISETTRRLVPSSPARTLKPVALKGLSAPVTPSAMRVRQLALSA